MNVPFVLTFGVVLTVAVLVSERAQRTVLSTAVIFLAAGFLIGNGGVGWLRLGPDDPLLRGFLEAALFTVLFTDGAQLRFRELRQSWRLPGRAILVALPLTMGGIALAGRWILDLTWIEAVLVGAILSPTDPVLIAALLKECAVPRRLRRVLRVESGLNDGLALPLVMIMLAVAAREPVAPLELVVDTAGGIVSGIVVAFAVVWLEKRALFGAASDHRSLVGVSIACLLFGINRYLGSNEFLAAFAGGVTLSSSGPDFAKGLLPLGRPLAEGLKLAALLAFGSLLSFSFLVESGAHVWAFAAVALLAVRPIALGFAFFRGRLSGAEWLGAAWFGPRGFASLFYALMVREADLPRSDWLFRTVAIVITLSIVVHSTTDVLAARIFRRRGRNAEA